MPMAVEPRGLLDKEIKAGCLQKGKAMVRSSKVSKTHLREV